MCAVSAGRTENVSLLLQAGADPNIENENKETVLHMTRSTTCASCWYRIDHTDILQLFLDQIISINKQV